MGDFAKDAGAVALVAAATAVNPLVGLAAAGGVAAASASVKSAGAQQVELDLAARQEKLAASEREVARKRRLNAVLGAQAAEAAAMGVGFSGSVANVSVSDASQASIDRLVDRSNTRLTIDRLRRTRSSVGKVGNVKAAGHILSTASTIFDTQRITKKQKTQPGAPI